MKKWTTCFVEFLDNDGKWYLSKIPWRILALAVYCKVCKKDDFQWNWVPPWKVKIVPAD